MCAIRLNFTRCRVATQVDSALQVGEGYEYERPAVTQRTAHAHGLFNRIQNEVLTKDFPGASAHMVRGVVNKWVEETENEAQEAEEAEDPEAQAAGFRGRLFSTVPPNASPRLKAVFGHTAEASRAAASSSGREQQLQYQQLRELKQLKDEGILTEREFDEHKALILQVRAYARWAQLSLAHPSYSKTSYSRSSGACHDTRSAWPLVCTALTRGIVD